MPNHMSLVQNEAEKEWHMIILCFCLWPAKGKSLLNWSNGCLGNETGLIYRGDSSDMQALNWLCRNKNLASWPCPLHIAWLLKTNDSQATWTRHGLCDHVTQGYRKSPSSQRAVTKDDRENQAPTFSVQWPVCQSISQSGGPEFEPQRRQP